MKDGKYRRAFLLGMQNGLEYRMEFFLNMVSAVFPMWSAIYKKTGEGVMFGYAYPQMILYTVLASILTRLLRTGFEYDIAEDIKSGGLNKFIIRPIHYFPYRLCAFLGQKTVHTGLFSVILLAAAVIASRATGLAIGAAQILCFFLSFVLNFILFYLVSTIAFWLSEIGFFFEAVRIVFIALSGGIFPIDVLGGRIADVLHLLPFQYVINFPIDVLNGRVSGADFFQGLAIQACWILLLAGAAALAWERGSKKYVAVGG
jgi:ABC-2 type transport system permease protein